MIQIDGPVTVQYDYWKELVTLKQWPHYYFKKGETNGGNQTYIILTGQRDVVAKHMLSDSSNISDWESNFKSDAVKVASIQEAALRLTDQPGHLSQTTKEGKPVTSQFPNTEPHANKKSFNFADPTSWHEQATFTSKETHTASADQTVVSLNNEEEVINATQANFHDEDHKTDSEGRDYKIEVWKNGTLQQEDDFHDGPGSGDFSVDYTNGDITFHNPLNDGDTIEASYHEQGGSRWSIAPEQGKKLSIARAELQASAELNMADSMRFEVMYRNADGDMVNAQTPNIYKTWEDVIIESNRAFPQHKPPSNPGKRDISEAIDVFQWDYLSTIELKSSLDMEMRVYCERDIPHDGTHLSITFYTIIEDE
jgi:hypothetical protein